MQETRHHLSSAASHPSPQAGTPSRGPSTPEVSLEVSTKLGTMFGAKQLLPALCLTVAMVVAETPPSAQVSAEIYIPPAVTHVIGDDTRLMWRFRNETREPIAFMWEGCCRLNGRLDVTAADGSPLELLPPVQALAHMFAKAEVLEPGGASDFDTRVSDWVQLFASGTYRLQGHYIGVLPEQQPQVPRGLQLWRDAATTPPILFQVISVGDYLAQRPDRSSRRSLVFELSGDAVVTPPEPVALRWELRNRSDQPQTVRWPLDVQVWVVDAHGQRMPNVPTLLAGDYEELTLPPGGVIARPFELDPIRWFEGVPFGDYRVFLDLDGPSAAEPRLPSNAIPLRWRLDDATVANLLAEAARGGRMAFRNAPLKLLRVYLGELGPQLQPVAANAQDSRTRALARELWLASRLKPLAPKPGRVEWSLRLAANGQVSLDEPALARVAQEVAATDPLAGLLGLRRHLGWEVGLNLQPEPDVPLSLVFQRAVDLQALSGPLGGIIRAGTTGDLTNRLGGVTVRPESVPAIGLVQLADDSLAPQGRRAPIVIPPDDLRQQPSESLADDEALSAWLGALPTGGLVQLEVAPTLTWGELARRVAPLLRRPAPVVLSPLRAQTGQAATP